MRDEFEFYGQIRNESIEEDEVLELDEDTDEEAVEEEEEADL